MTEARKREPRAPKRLQAIENTGCDDVEKDATGKSATQRHGGRSTEATEGTPPGNSDGYQNKGLVGRAIRKVVKTKGK
jgi:hypothetical protein